MGKFDQIDNFLCQYREFYDNRFPPPDEQSIQHAVSASIRAFYERDRQLGMRYFEFLFCQFLYLRKRWWLMQLAALGLILRILVTSDNDSRRCIGGLAPLFVLLIVPELWRNRHTESVEIEGAALYSLRQIYAARMLLFAMADTLFLMIFCGLATCTAQITLTELTTQFLFPLSVTCCICFRFLCSRHADSEYYAAALSILWSCAWVFLILPSELYDAMAPAVGLGLTALSICYLAWLARRAIRTCDSCLETGN